MTRKKMRKIIISGVLIFYIFSLLFAFVVSDSAVSQNFRDEYGNSFFRDFQYKLERYKEPIEERESTQIIGCTPGEFFAYYLSYDYKYADYPRVFAVVDKNLNITYLDKNFICIEMVYEEGWVGCDTFIGLDDYLTEETKKEMISFIRYLEKKNPNGYDIEKAEIYYDGQKYIPVTVEIGTYINREMVKKSFTLTSYKPNIILEEPDANMTVCFTELELPFYHRDNFERYTKEIEHFFELNIDNFSADGGGGSTGGNDCIYSMGFEIRGEEYEIYTCGGFDIMPHVLLSDSFFGCVVYLGILFSVAGLIFYIICMKVVKKNEKLEEAKSTFISAASHELKTPIAVIQNRCECLMENIAPEKRDSYLKAIHDEALRMDSIVASLLTYNRITQLMHIEKEKCDLSELVRQEINSYLAFAQKSGVIFEENTEDGIYAQCNVQLMKMAIDNYLSNAVRYTQGDRRVTVNLSKKEKGFIFEVTNEADESSVADAKEAWLELSKGDKSRQRQGTSIGMGLAICRKIFDLHGYKGYSRYKNGKVTFVIEGC